MVWLVRTLIDAGQIDCGWHDGVIHTIHRPGREAETREHVEYMQQVYGQKAISYPNHDRIRAEVGTTN